MKIYSIPVDFPRLLTKCLALNLIVLFVSGSAVKLIFCNNKIVSKDQIHSMPSAYVLITCELGYEEKTMSKLNKLTGVDATRLDGAYDIIAKINAESTEILTKIIGLDMKKMDRIQSTVTLILIEEDQRKEESK